MKDSRGKLDSYFRGFYSSLNSFKDLQAPAPIHTYITIDKVLPIQYN